MQTLFAFMVNNGVPKETIIFLLLLPVLATIIAIARQIVGINAFGIYMPLILSFAFMETGLQYGLAIFAVVILSGTIFRLIVRHFSLLFYPRIAIVLTSVAAAVLLLFAEGAYSGRTVLISSSIFPILIIVLLVERFVSTQIEKGARTAVLVTIETIVLSILCYFIAEWRWFRENLFDHPQWVLLTLVINIFLGRWTGLRLREYFRFRDVLKYVDDPKKR
jgi:hypothetical protein